MDPSQIVDDALFPRVADKEMRAATGEGDEGEEVAVYEGELGDVLPGEERFPAKKNKGEKVRRARRRVEQKQENRTNLAALSTTKLNKPRVPTAGG